MKRRTLLQAGAAGLTPAASLSLAATGPTSGREVLTLTQGWRFHDGDIPAPKILGHDWTYGSAKAGNAQGAAAPDYDDSDWPLVNLPHDFAASQPIEQGTNVSQGYRRRGMAWYRQSVKFDDADRGRHLELQIDGAATHATVWVNGTLVHHNYSGYNEMAIDLTPYATYGEAVNTIVVRVDAVAMEGWWYEGAGLYREVRIVKRAATHIVTDGVFAHPVKRGEGWVIPIEVTLATLADKAQPVTLECELLDARGTHAKASTRVQVPMLRQAVAKLQIKHDKPELWSPARPHLYRVVTRVLQGGQVLDELTTPCGFRTQHFDADRGFFLNGQPLKIQGVCIHQDHAGVGVAVPPALIDFRLRRLKELGCNAIRASHNAQDRAFMDACDRLGFLVMAENRLFNPSPQYVEQQLKWLVRRDRNHPSVFMWSVFNEEPMQGTAGGYEMVRRMREVVRDLDTSRPVTAAMNDGLFTPLNVSHALDVLGFNYQQDQYDAVHAARPKLPLMSSEDTSAFMLRGYYGPRDDKRHLIPSYDDDAAPWGATHRKAWKAIAERPFIAGGFVWTGFDYHGEPTPYEWPSNSSVFGIMDLCGFEKTAFHIHQAQWVHDRPVLALVPHWNWQGREGQPVKVMVCSNLDEVGLELNGRLLGRQPVDRWTMNHWQVPYEAGTLRALGWKAGRLVAKAQVETVGAPTALRLVPDRKSLSGDGVDVVPVRVEAIDAQGRAHPLANHMVQFHIEGGEIIGLGNGDSNSTEPEKGDRRSLFNGLAQVIVRSNAGGTGELKLTASTDGLQAASVSLALSPAAAPRQQATGTSLQVLLWWQRAPLQATAPDPQLQPPPQDMNSWQGFQAGNLLPAAASAGYVLCAINHTPYSRIRREGGWVEAPSVTGRCEVYSNGVLLGRKAEAATAPLRLRLPPGEGQRRLAFVFQVDAGEKVGLGSVVKVRV
ncbi:beta-galactosidase GalA [Roseateles sp.]|uniref:beta-galactosidase GalA n=1 Tax=Roseateles sp. TaxID=1971397 RepID=UPI00395227A1